MTTRDLQKFTFKRKKKIYENHECIKLVQPFMLDLSQCVEAVLVFCFGVKEGAAMGGDALAQSKSCEGALICASAQLRTRLRI